MNILRTVSLGSNFISSCKGKSVNSQGLLMYPFFGKFSKFLSKHQVVTFTYSWLEMSIPPSHVCSFILFFWRVPCHPSSSIQIFTTCLFWLCSSQNLQNAQGGSHLHFLFWTVADFVALYNTCFFLCIYRFHFYLTYFLVYILSFCFICWCYENLVSSVSLTCFHFLVLQLHYWYKIVH